MKMKRMAALVIATAIVFSGVGTVGVPDKASAATVEKIKAKNMGKLKTGKKKNPLKPEKNLVVKKKYVDETGNYIFGIVPQGYYVTKTTVKVKKCPNGGKKYINLRPAQSNRYFFDLYGYLKKGIKKGTYVLTIKSKGNKYYKPATKIMKIVVK